MKNAAGANYACIIGPEETANKSVAVKNMENGEQTSVPFDDAAQYLRRLIFKEGV